MKKNLLFGIALIMLIGCSKKEENEVSPAKVKNQNNLKSAPASYVWETFSPCLKPTNYPINACVAITITTDPKPCCKCNGTFSKPLSDEIELAH